ncbi:MAG: hypothetical protein IJ220_04915 [Clostridia bacterium]|nr:hypothetical protein [Clostridia bacterium]
MKNLQFRKTIRDNGILTDITSNLKQLLTINNIDNYSQKADRIYENLKSFKKVIAAHRNIPFSYIDSLNTELSHYQAGYICTICVFDGELYRTPIDLLPKTCNLIMLRDGSTLPYPENIKIGNEAIGQAWVNNQEVFSPRHALNHSINSTIRMLLGWVASFQKNLIKEVW